MRFTRRAFFKVILGLSVQATVGGVYSAGIEPFMIDTTRLTVKLPNLPPALAGLTIAQFSDIHFGSWMTMERATDIVNAVNALNADVIVYTGDFFSEITFKSRNELKTTFGTLRAPLGVYGILGNHDHWTNAAEATAAVHASGVRLLHNEHVILERDNASLYLAGLDDIWSGDYDLEKALDGIPDKAPLILLAHEPDYADVSVKTGRIGLQLSGHSHGGQVRLPIKGAIMLPHLGEKYDQGRYQIEDMTLYVNRGVGTTFPFVRFGCPPEITLITLA